MRSIAGVQAAWKSWLDSPSIDACEQSGKVQRRRLSASRRVNPRHWGWSVDPQNGPWLDARGLRMQIEELLSAVQDLMNQNPGQELSNTVLGMIFRILSVFKKRYTSRLILDIDILESRWRASEPIYAVEMKVFLGSVRGSLRRLEELGPEQWAHGSTTEPSSPWRSGAQHYPPDESEDWRRDEGEKDYWSGARSQHRRAAANRSRQRPW